VSRDVYRIQITVPAGGVAKQEVVEESIRIEREGIGAIDDDALRILLVNDVASPALKAAMTKAAELRHRLHETKSELAQEEAQLKALADDQARIRANLKEMPPTAAAYKRYLDKFDVQENEVERLQARIKQLNEAVKQRQKEFSDYVADLTVE
jgi:septal ring factor EnvC (AmiA/AmiB activator)